MDLKEKIVAIDFDSTIASYQGFKGKGVFGEPLQNAKWAIDRMKEMGATVVIHTCRSETNLIAAYLKEHNIDYDYINFSPKNVEYKLSDAKIYADIYIDDKAINFSGQWGETMRQLLNFTPWEKKDANKAISGSTYF